MEKREKFVDHTFLQSTLRELQAVWRSPRLWGTFITVVLIFAVTGPYGTFARLMPGARFGYWLVLHAMAWSIAIVLSIAAEVLLRKWMSNMLARMMTGAVISALPIGFGISLVDLAFFGDVPTVAAGLRQSLTSIPLCLLFCFLTYMTMHREIAIAAEAPHHEMPVPAPLATSEMKTTPAQAPILSRLKPENRGQLIRLAVRDHYTEVVTTRGRELILLRFGDALMEIGDTEGLRLHRSHWIATGHVAGLKRDNGKLLVITRDGVEMPVSRPYAEAVRRRFG
ncbi:LytTR family DNA-binding domain-containing protein [Rhizobium sp. BR 314]|uniref:LytTR family DNA-binding domain-containing protein n=1 Tax=Rhizobium sp. BR 314 TaxID=3040013 RepID=UPI0039BF1084